jgi:hypothetical protein
MLLFPKVPDAHAFLEQSLGSNVNPSYGKGSKMGVGHTFGLLGWGTSILGPLSKALVKNPLKKKERARLVRALFIRLCCILELFGSGGVRLHFALDL